MTKIKMQNTTRDYSIKETFNRYLTAVEASGATKKTISSYYDHFRCLSKHIEVEMPIKDLSRDDLDYMNTSLRKSNLAHNSICSYARVMRAFLNWCHTEGYTSVSSFIIHRNNI